MKKNHYFFILATLGCFLTGCTVREVAYVPAYNNGYAATTYTNVNYLGGYYSSSPYWGSGYSNYNGYGYDNGWYGTSNYYGTTVYSSDW